MKVLIHGVHFQIDAALKRYIDKHLVRPIARLYRNEAAELEIHLCESSGARNGIDKECRVTAFLHPFPPIHVHEVSDDIHKSIDFAKDRLLRQTKRSLERLRGAHRHGPNRHPVAAYP